MNLTKLILRFAFAATVSVLMCGSLLADLLVSDYGGNAVFRFNQTTGALIGSGPFIAAGSGGLSGPVGLRLDVNGDLLVANQNTDQILRFNANTGSFLGVYGSTGSGPADIRFHGSNLFVADFFGSSVDIVTSGSVTPFTNGGPGIAGTSSFAFGPNGDLYVGSFNSGDIQVFDGMSGTYLNTFASGLPAHSGLLFEGSDLWVASLFTGDISRFDSSGNLIDSFSTGTTSFPSHIIVNPNNSSELLIALTGAGGVYRFSKSGTPLGLFAGGMTIPGQMLLVSSVPEPTAGIVLSALVCGLLFRRRR